MMTGPRLEREGAVARPTLDRPESATAINEPAAGARIGRALLGDIALADPPAHLTLAYTAIGANRRLLLDAQVRPFEAHLDTEPRSIAGRARKPEGREGIAAFRANGGAIGIGHPLGASGTKLMATLVHALKARGGRYGLQTMCEGGGMANVTIVATPNR